MTYLPRLIKMPIIVHDKELLEKHERLINSMINKLKENSYNPTAIWISLQTSELFVVTDDIDRGEYSILIASFK